MSRTFTPKGSRRATKPAAVPSVETLACEARPGETHKLVNAAARGGLVTCCRWCARSWSEIDAEARRP